MIIEDDDGESFARCDYCGTTEDLCRDSVGYYCSACLRNLLMESLEGEKSHPSEKVDWKKEGL